MRKNIVEFVQYETKPLPFVPIRRFDRLRWWIVRRLGGDCPLDSVKFTRFAIDPALFIERIYKQKQALANTFRREAQILLIGAEDFEELMNTPHILQAIQFRGDLHFGRREVYGLTVQVIPWMRGCIVMP